MCRQIVLVSCLVAGVLGQSQYPPQEYPTKPYPAPSGSPSYQKPAYEEEYEKGMPFEFEYAVKDEYSGNDYSHRSESDGYVTKGEYRVLLPDTRVEIVTYTADKNGYQAIVRYEGDAVFPEPRPYQPQQGQQYQQAGSSSSQQYQPIPPPSAYQPIAAKEKPSFKPTTYKPAKKQSKKPAPAPSQAYQPPQAHRPPQEQGDSDEYNN